MANNKSEVYYSVALGFVCGVGPKTSAALLAHFGSAKAALNAAPKELMRIEGMGKIKAYACKDERIYELAEEELKFATQNNIKILTKGSAEYPTRLTHCADAPDILYYKGDADLNATKVISVVGTRNNTEYGVRLCNELIEGFAGEQNVLVVSGLAIGIDTIAHRAALQFDLPTVGVVAHGLNMVYPANNIGLARKMIQHKGGILTEFGTGSKLDRKNFPARNRIVAGMSDVTVVVESDIKGGALITAHMAQSYHRDVAAFPGRAYDHKSAGANVLIRNNVAALIDSADDLRDLMNWQKRKEVKSAVPPIANTLSAEEQKIVALMGNTKEVHADFLRKETRMREEYLLEVLLELEFKRMIKSRPGNFYCIY